MNIIDKAGNPIFPETKHRLVETLVESKTNRGDFYHVAFSCTCKGFIFNQKCSHIQLALDAK